MKFGDRVPNEIGLTDREMLFCVILLLIVATFFVLGLLSTINHQIELRESAEKVITWVTKGISK